MGHSVGNSIAVLIELSWFGGCIVTVSISLMMFSNSYNMHRAKILGTIFLGENMSMRSLCGVIFLLCMALKTARAFPSYVAGLRPELALIFSGGTASLSRIPRHSW